MVVDDFLRTIREELISRANGVFLWAVLVSRRLLEAFDSWEEPAKLRNLLISLSLGLDDLFNEIFNHTGGSKAKRQDLLRFAQWIFCSFRPLTLPEFFTAVSLQTGHSTQAFTEMRMSEDAYKRLEKRIIDASGGLFEVIRREDYTRVQVIHESVREFFLRPNGLELMELSSPVQFHTLDHKELASACFKALLAKEFYSILPENKIKRR